MKQYRVNMIFGKDEVYEYGTYESRNQANEVAKWVRDTRECDIWVEEIEE